MVLNSRIARQALKQAGSSVNARVREGAEAFVEREVSPLRARIEELEERVKELERQLARLNNDRR